MKNLFLTLSVVALMVAMTGCKQNEAMKNEGVNPAKQEREFLREI